MLKSRTNIKTLLAIVTGVLALGISIPTSGNISLTAPAMANMGGGGGGGGGSIEALMERMAQRRDARRGTRADRRRAATAARRAAREARRHRRATERAARRRVIADRMRARRILNAAARNVRRMFNMDFNNDSASSFNQQTGITTTSRSMPNGNHAVTLTNAQGAVVNNFVVQR